MKPYDVVVTFTVWGMVGREQYQLEADDERQAAFKGYRELEQDMIDTYGLATHECGCCLLPSHVGGDVEQVDCFAEAAQ